MYKYEDFKPDILTDDGQRNFLKVRDHVFKLLEKAGVVRMQEAVSIMSGDNWLQFAYVDRMVELGEIQEITGEGVAGQHRMFVKV